MILLSGKLLNYVIMLLYSTATYAIPGIIHTRENSLLNEANGRVTIMIVLKGMNNTGYSIGMR